MHTRHMAYTRHIGTLTHKYLDTQMTCTVLSLLNAAATKRKRPQKPAVQVDDTEIKGMQPRHP